MPSRGSRPPVYVGLHSFLRDLLHRRVDPALKAGVIVGRAYGTWRHDLTVIELRLICAQCYEH